MKIKPFSGALALVGAAALVLGSSTVVNAAEPRQKQSYKVVQLGDSYSAGNGAGRYWGDPEARLSHNNYAEVYTDWLNSQPDLPTRYTTYAHSGAETNDMLSTQIPQVPNDADLVMFTIGGNDVNFQDIVKYCFVVGFRSASDCRDKITAANGALPKVERQLGLIIQSIAERLQPGAEIVLVGYPQLSTSPANNLCDYVALCWGSHSYDASKGVRDLGTSAGQMQRRVVDAWNAANPANPVLYVDQVAATFEGHEPDPSLWTKNPQQWLNGLGQTETYLADATTGYTDWSVSSDKLNWYHPGTIGHAKVAEVIEKQIGITPRARRVQANNAAVTAASAASHSSVPMGRSVTVEEQGAVDQMAALAEPGAPSAWLLGPFVQRVGTSIDFDARGSIGGDSDIVSYEWDFDGDGVTDATTADPTVTRRFDAVYHGVVSVRVTQEDGRSSTASTSVQISEDGDSTPGEVDNCPDLDNYSQSDEDGDGVGDDCDASAGHPVVDLPGVRVIEGGDNLTRVGPDGDDVPADSDGSSLALASATTTAGAALTYRAEGFTAGDAVEVWWDGSETVQLNATAVVEADGSVAGTLIVPADATAGSYRVIVAAEATLASRSVEVTAAEVAPGTPVSPADTSVVGGTSAAGVTHAGLARTGSDISPAGAGIALLALLGGAVLLLIRSRQKVSRG